MNLTPLLVVACNFGAKSFQVLIPQFLPPRKQPLSAVTLIAWWPIHSTFSILAGPSGAIPRTQIPGFTSSRRIKLPSLRRRYPGRLLPCPLLLPTLVFSKRRTITFINQKRKMALSTLLTSQEGYPSLSSADTSASHNFEGSVDSNLLLRGKPTSPRGSASQQEERDTISCTNARSHNQTQCAHRHRYRHLSGAQDTVDSIDSLS